MHSHESICNYSIRSSKYVINHLNFLFFLFKIFVGSICIFSLTILFVPLPLLSNPFVVAIAEISKMDDAEKEKLLKTLKIWK